MGQASKEKRLEEKYKTEMVKVSVIERGRRGKKKTKTKERCEQMEVQWQNQSERQL